jgi:signal transduction histidine kinase
MKLARKLESEKALLGAVGGVLLLLLCLALQAFWLLNSDSEAQLQSYHTYVEIDASLADMRRAVWLGVNHARDFLLQPRETAHGIYRDKIREMRKQARDPLTRLEKTARLGEDVRRLRQWYTRYETTLDAFPAEFARSGLSGAQFVQERLVPMRVNGLRISDELSRKAFEELQSEEARYRQRRRETASRMLLMVVLALAAGLLVAWLSYRTLRRSKLERDSYNQRLAQANQDLEQLSARILEVQEEERRSFSRELHDEIGQTLTALRIEISQSQRVAGEAEVQERLSRARGLAEKAVKMVRDISLALRPPLLDDLGLGSALAWQIEEFSRRSGIQADFRGEDVGEDLPDPIKTCVFRVAQESLNNCEKYAGASRVSVNLTANEQTLELEIRDNGVGFPLDDRGLPPFGTGIFGMRERLAQLGGTLEVNSRPREGTSILARLPLRSEAARPAAMIGREL